MKYLKDSKIITVVVAVVCLVVGIGSIIYFSNKNNINNQVEVEQFDAGMNFQDVSSDQSENKKEEEKKANKIYIHIIGEVNNSGVIELEKGNRIVDAIKKAGGVTEKADLAKVNLVFVLSDGQKIRIPSVDDKEKVEYVIKDNGNNIIENSIYNSGLGGGKVNLNSATQTELETLSGIGPSLAARILEYRNKVGKFKKIDELKNVKGIGDSKFQNIKDQVVID
ncbi:MAG: helix-hairpin-helix domain-containing protein [Clostridia bacterium]|nr:helix-hairpin-helix domain-containing protein [Clostridia bacterium]